MNTELEKEGRKARDNICQKLIDEGWKEYKDAFHNKYTRNFYKRFDTPTRCRSNNDRDLSVHVSISNFDQYTSYEIEVAGEMKDGTWIKLHNWVMPPDIDDGLKLIPRLLDTWEYINNQ